MEPVFEANNDHIARQCNLTKALFRFKNLKLKLGHMEIAKGGIHVHNLGTMKPGNLGRKT